MVIRADILNSLSEIHAELTAMGVKDLWLFGSAARGELANDADFLVDFQSTPTLVGFMNLKFLLEDINNRNNINNINNRDRNRTEAEI